MEKESVERDLKIIQEILCRLLGRECMDEDEDIYIAGVTSIMALPLLVEVEDAFKLTIRDSDFLGAHTVRALAQLIRQLRATSQRCV
jgi:acyl carrier protein